MAEQPKVIVVCSWCLRSYHYDPGNRQASWSKTSKEVVDGLVQACRAVGGGATHGCCPDCYPAMLAQAQAAAKQKQGEFDAKRKRASGER